jgi:ribulose-phosphate 3-epimerase
VDPEIWKDLTAKEDLAQDFQLEVHLMVSEPEKIVDAWLAAGAKRVIVHVETLEKGIEDIEIITGRVQDIKKQCQLTNAVLVLAAQADTDPRKLTQYGDISGEGEDGEDAISEFCVLAVNPGPAGQPLQPKALELIWALHRALPQAHIEVDGGINPETADRVREAGAISVCAGTYIFSHAHPQEAFGELQNALQLKA